MVMDAVVVTATWLGVHAVAGQAVDDWWRGIAALAVVTATALAMLSARHLYRYRAAVVRTDELARLMVVALVTGLSAAAGNSVFELGYPAWVAAVGGGATFVTLAYARGRYDTWIRARRSEGRFTQPVLILGDNDEAVDLVRLLDESPELGFRPVGYVGREPDIARVDLPWHGGVDDVVGAAVRTGASGVFVVARCVPERRMNPIIRELHSAGIRVHLSSGVTGLHRRRLRVVPIAHEPLLYVEPCLLSAPQLAAKRVLDVVVASVGLVVTAPVMAVVAIAIKLSDGGPILFRQERIGLNGVPFTLLKLRTMSVDAEQRLEEIGGRNQREGPLFKIDDDPRVTRVGRWLRDSSIDEIPQLLNVLRGDMSLVGPRPALAREVSQFDDELLDRLRVKPGVSGLWQIEARDKASFHAYRRLDLFYVENWSFALDLAVLCGTGRAVLGRFRRAVRFRRTRRAAASDGVVQMDPAGTRGRARSRRPGVLVIVQNMPVPLDRRVWQECRTLVDAGYRVSVICPRGEGQGRLQEIDSVKIRTYRPPPATSGAISYAFEFAYCWLRTLGLSLQTLVRDGFDVIQACNPPDTYFALALLYRPLGKRFVYDQHDLCPEVYASRFDRQDGLLLKVVRGLERATYRTAHHVIVTNESYRETALRRGGLARESVTVVRSGPDPTRMVRGEAHPELRKGRRHLCCWLGIMGPQDGVDLLLRSIDAIVHDLGRDDVHFAILGYGDCLEDLRRLSTELGLDDVVTFTGRADAGLVSAYFSTADIGLSSDPLSPLNDVSTMNKTMEYMAFGLPVVAYDLKETRVSAGPAAVYVEPNDVLAYAKAVSHLLDNPVERQAMGLVARSRIENELAWQRQTAGYVAAFDRLVGRAVPDRNTAGHSLPRRQDEAIREVWAS